MPKYLIGSPDWTCLISQVSSLGLTCFGWIGFGQALKPLSGHSAMRACVLNLGRAWTCVGSSYKGHESCRRGGLVCYRLKLEPLWKLETTNANATVKYPVVSTFSSPFLFTLSVMLLTHVNYRYMPLPRIPFN